MINWNEIFTLLLKWNAQHMHFRNDISVALAGTEQIYSRFFSGMVREKLYDSFKWTSSLLQWTPAVLWSKALHFIILVVSLAARSHCFFEPKIPSTSSARKDPLHSWTIRMCNGNTFGIELDTPSEHIECDMCASLCANRTSCSGFKPTSFICWT